MRPKYSRGQALRAARSMAEDPKLLFRVGKLIGRAGVVGESRNRLILFLAGLTTAFREAVSVLVAGRSSTGKSTLLNSVANMFPPELVTSLTSLTAKALAYMDKAIRILVLAEFRGGKDSRYLMRLLQSEGVIYHQHTTVVGNTRTARVATQEGRPVVLTSSTESHIFVDDATRFLLINVDESAEQTLQILRATIENSGSIDEMEVAAVQQSTRMILKDAPEITIPDWLMSVVENLPTSRLRMRRDWPRFLSFCKAIALCRRFDRSKDRTGDALEISFADYCVGYKLLNSAFSSTLHGISERAFELASAVRKLHAKRLSAISRAEVSEHLNWKPSLTHKIIQIALDDHLVEHEPGTRQRNEKRLLPIPDAAPGFLPAPSLVLSKNPSIKVSTEYVDPLTGDERSAVRRT